MAYVHPNVPTKKALKEAVLAGHEVTVYQPGGIFPLTPLRKSPAGEEYTVEGPHAPKPHTWYGRVLVKDGKVIKVLS